MVSKFKKSPVAFLRSLISLRRKGMSFEGSHLGRILNGELLKQEHFEIPGSRVEDVTDSEDDVAWEFWVDIGVHDDMTIAAC